MSQVECNTCGEALTAQLLPAVQMPSRAESVHTVHETSATCKNQFQWWCWCSPANVKEVTVKYCLAGAVPQNSIIVVLLLIISIPVQFCGVCTTTVALLFS